MDIWLSLLSTESGTKTFATLMEAAPTLKDMGIYIEGDEIENYRGWGCPKRQGAYNIRRTLCLLSCTKNNSQQRMMPRLDAKKAFDWVKWSFIYHSSALVFGFYTISMDWMKLMI